jgi:hypothetical protein
MKAMKSVVVAVVLVFCGMGCASTGDEASTTQVDGMVVSDGADDWDREYSDEEVEAFAAAYVEVTNIQQRYQRKIADADEGQRQTLSRESAELSEEAMLSHGVTPQEYNGIAVRLPDDDELRQRVHHAVQEMETRRLEETQRNLESE